MIFVYFRTVFVDVKFQENCLDVFHCSSEDFSNLGVIVPPVLNR